jgi:hypothetical protein
MDANRAFPLRFRLQHLRPRIPSGIDVANPPGPHGELQPTTPQDPRCATKYLAYAVAPLLIILVFGLFQCARTESIANDGVLFIRYARQLAGELPLTNAEQVRPQRGALARRLIDRLCNQIHALTVMERHHQHPGYPLLILALQRCLGSWLASDPVMQWARAGQLGSLLGGCVLAGSIYWLGLHLLGRTAALTAATILATAQPIVWVYSDVLSDAPGLACLTLSALFAVRLVEGGTVRDAAMSGILGGIGYLFRPEAAQAALLVAVVIAGRLAIGHETGRRQVLARGVALLLPLVLLCTPYMVLRGSMLTKKAHLFRARLELPETPLPRPAVTIAASARARTEVTHEARSSTIEHHSYVVGMYRFLVRWGQNLGYLFLLPLVVGWWVTRGRLRDRPGLRLVAGLTLCNFIALPMLLFQRAGYLESRHVMPTVVLTTFWCQPGLLAIAHWLCGLHASVFQRKRLAGARRPLSSVANRLRYRTVTANQLAAAMAIAGILACSASSLLRPLHWERRGYRVAGEWLRSRAPDGATILDPELLTGFYAGLEGRNLWDRAPHFSLSHLERLLRDGPPVAYVVLSDRFMSSQGLPPQLPDRLGAFLLTRVQSFPCSGDSTDSNQVHIVRAEQLLSVVTHP